MIGQVYLRIVTGQLYGLMTIAKMIDSEDKYVLLLSMTGEIILVPYIDFFSNNNYQPTISLNELSGLINGVQNIAGNATLIKNFDANYQTGE